MKLINNIKGFEDKEGYLFISLEKETDGDLYNNILSYQKSYNPKMINIFWEYTSKFPENFISRVNDRIIDFTLFYKIIEKDKDWIVVAFGTYHEENSNCYSQANINMLKKGWANFLSHASTYSK